MLRSRGVSFSERRDAVVKLCKGYVEQLQGKNPFKLSLNDIRALITKSISCDDARDRILSFRDELAVSCMEEILQVREIRPYPLRTCQTNFPPLDSRGNIARNIR